MFCSQCGQRIPEGGVFCPACGTRVTMPEAAAATPPAQFQAPPAVPVQPPQATAVPPPPSPPPAPALQYCPSCGSGLTPGRRFCTRCGYSLTGAAAAAAPARSGAASGPLLASFAPTELGVLAGLALAAIGTLLDWARFSGVGVTGWNGDARFRVANWLDVAAPIDAILVVALVVVGAAVMVHPAMRTAKRTALLGTAAAGLALAVLGLLQVVYIRDFGVSVGVGVYAIIVGGGAATALGVMSAYREIQLGPGR
jgi:hypothetical protein